MICGHESVLSCSHCPKYTGCSRSYEAKCEDVVANACALLRQRTGCDAWYELDYWRSANSALFGSRPLWG